MLTGVLTCPSEDDIVDVAVQRPHPLHHDLRVVDVFGDEARPVADGHDRVLQQGVVLDKLQRLVRQVESAVYVLPPHLVVDALEEEEEEARASVLRLPSQGVSHENQLLRLELP